MNQKHKYLTLDAIRGVAALFVLTRHAGQLFGGLQFQHAHLAVDLFFVMSGFVLSVAYDEDLLSKKITLSDFVKIRAIRLYPLYFVAVIFSILLNVYHARTDISNFNWVELLGEAFFGLLLIPSPVPGHALFPLNGPSWSIFFEVIVNILFAAFRKSLSNKVLLYVIAGSLVMMAICAFVNNNIDVGWNWNNSLWGLPRVIYSFSAGLGIYRIRKILRFEKIFNSWLTLVVLFIAMLFLGLPVTQFTGFYEFNVTIFCIPSLVLIATYIEPSTGGKLMRVFPVLGLASYAIYILQAPFVWAYSGAFVKHGFTSVIPGSVAVIGLFLLSLFLDFAYDQPIRRLLKVKFLDPVKYKSIL